MPGEFSLLVYTFLGLPLAVLVLFNLLGRRLVLKFYIPVGIVTCLVQMFSSVVSLLLLVQHGKEAITFSQFWNYQLHEGSAFFSPDAFSFLALFCIGLVGLITFLVAHSTLVKKPFYFCNVLLVLILGMNGMALVYDLFSLYVFLEVTSLAAFILIALYRDARGLEGSFKYLMMSSVASALILVGISLIFLNNGSLQYDAVGEYLADWESASNPILMQLAFIMLISGFSIKAGVAPFHGWLPDAYQSAPAAVSVILGGIVTKMAGVYAIVRLMGDWLVEAPVVGIAFMLLGLFSIILGSLSAVGSHNLKRVLAFSSISQVGYIVLSVSTGSALGLFAAIFHFFNHTIFKTTLYVNSAALEAQCKTIMLERLGGLQKQMPVTAISNILAFLSTAGIPPLAGFWSKLLIIIAVWQTHGGIVAGLALFFSIFTIIYFLLVQRKVFFGASRESLKDVKEARFPIRLASIILSCITVGVGFLFPWLLRFMEANAWI